ncbi:YozE family protein, partial [Staphylococcus aureus]
KHNDEFNILSDYIETHGDFTLPMCVFDDLYEEYTEWLKF